MYENAFVNLSLLNKLALEDASYSGYLLILQNLTFEWKVTAIQDSDNLWVIRTEVWFRNEMIDKFNSHVYKSAQEFSHELFNGSKASLFYFPVNISSYLLQFNHSIPDQERIHAQCNESAIIFDWTSMGQNDTNIYKYNKFGMMESFIIQYNHTKAFEFKLVQFKLGFDMSYSTG